MDGERTMLGTKVSLFIRCNTAMGRTPNQEKRFNFGNDIKNSVVDGVNGMLRFTIDMLKSFEDRQTVREDDIISVVAGEGVKG